MKRFIYKILLIISPLLLIAFILEVLTRKIPNDYSLKSNTLDTYASSINTIILGSSHSLYGINPAYFNNNTFNASHVSQSLNFDLEILKKYQDSLTCLRTIVLPISYFTLFTRLEDGPEAWRIKNYIIYYGITKLSKINNYFEITSNQFRNILKRIYGYYILSESNITCTMQGWGTTYKSSNFNNLAPTGVGAASRHTKFGSDGYQEILEKNVLLLKKIILWCESRNIKVLLFLPPAYQTYRNNLNREQLKLTVSKCEELVKHKNNCKYINMINHPMFKEEDYYDADHLSEIGAKKLSLMINQIIVDW